MPPAPLQFELLPRRRKPWLRPLSVGLLVFAGGVAAIWLWPRQLRLAELQTQLDAMQASTSMPANAPAPRAPAAWMAAAEQEQALFALPLEPRLLEIERCTEGLGVVTRIVHDGSSGATTVELNLPDPARIPALLECFNTGAEPGGLHWRLAGTEVSTLPAAGQMQRVVLKR